jgi:hypothetical protein
MSKFPEPPQTLTVPAELAVLDAGTVVWRIYGQGGSHPSTWNAFRNFGPTLARFDHHLEPAYVQARGILYGAIGDEALCACVAEVFQVTRVIDRLAEARWVVALRLTRPVRLLDLTGSWPTAAGASMAIHSGPRARARRWSQVIYAT